MSNMAKLRNWYRESGTKKLIGEVYCDPRFDDGTSVITTPVQTQDRMGDALVACTLNTHYELCRGDGSEWFSVPGAELPADQPEANASVFITGQIQINQTGRPH